MFYGLVSVYPQSKKSMQVPLYLRKIEGEFHDFEYNITETHRYLHRGSDVLETEFTFPNTEITIYAFEYQIEDGPWTVMKVEPKNEAEKKYQMAVDAGHQAFLGKENTQKGLYTVKIGRLEPNQLVSVRFSYYSYYQITPKSLNTRLQLTKIPTYQRSTDQDDKDQPKMVDGLELDYGIYFSGRFYRSESNFKLAIYGDLESNFETTTGVIDVKKIVLGGQKDVSFRIVPEKPIISSVSGWVHPETEEKYLQVVWANYMNAEQNSKLKTMTEEFTSDEWEVINYSDNYKNAKESTDVSSKEYNHRVTMIVDGSGSMWGERIENAKQAVHLALQDIPENYQLSLAVFGSSSLFCPSASRLTSGSTYDWEGNKKEDVLKLNVHSNTYCDVCNINPIPGNKYACTTEPDYDLCTDCFHRVKQGSEISPYTVEQFEKVPPPQGTLDFNVVDHHNFWRDYTPNSLEFFNKFVKERINSNYGGTEMFSVLNETYARINATSDPKKKYHNSIIFLTDGGVAQSQQQEIMSLIKKNANTTNFFSIGVGSGTDTQFLKNMAKSGNGLSCQITNPEDVGDQVQLIVRCLSNPNMRNISFKWNGLEVEEAAIKPSNVLFNNEPYVLLAKILKESGDNHSISLETTFSNQDVKTLLTLDLNEIDESNFPLDRTFATAYIQKLIDYPESVEMDKATRIQTITDLAVKYGIVTPFTSAIAVEYKDDADGSQVPTKVSIPIGAPESSVHVGAMLRNDNLQLRSQPPTSVLGVGPWNQPTFKPDTNRRIYRSVCAGKHGHPKIYSMIPGVPESLTVSVNLGSENQGATLYSSKSSVGGAAASGVASAVAYSQEFTDGEEEDCSNFDDDFSFDDNLSEPKKTKSVRIETPIVTRLRNLVLLKKSDNTWEMSDKLLNWLDMTNEEATKAMDQMTNVEDKLKVTYLVLCFFHQHLDKSYIWSGVYNKIVKSHFSQIDDLENKLITNTF